MKKILSLCIFISVLSIKASVISGNVLLDNVTDYSGVKVKFNPVSASAVFIETTSLSNGSFSVNVVNGVYDIVYEKNGYQKYHLKNQFFSKDSLLLDITLSSSVVFEISGDVFGKWTKTNTYIVNDNITVPFGQKLEIEQGTQIKFNGYYSFIVNGTLEAIGTENEYIIFTSNKSTPTKKDWNQIQINSSTKSILNYCIIEYAKEQNSDNYGMLHVTGTADIENSIFRNGEESGISVRDAGIVAIKNTTIENCSYGIYINSSSDINISNNKISNLNLIGMAIHLKSSNTKIEKNKISDCKVYGIQTWANITINNNLLFNNGNAIQVNGNAPLIRNNTFFKNNNGIVIYLSDFFKPNPNINSNIIVNSSNYAIKSEGKPMPSNVSYNLFFNNGLGIGNKLPIGVGTVVTKNNNTDADTYFNIFSDPNFNSTESTSLEFLSLASSSVAINAGDPNVLNSNISRIDIGALESTDVLSTSSIQLEKEREFNLFPNPVRENLTIKSLKNNFKRISVINQLGKRIIAVDFVNKESEYTFGDLSTLFSGVYFINVEFESGETAMRKFIKN
jgi:parallel beta-helix repeat protein